MRNLIAFILSFFDRRTFGALRSPDWREVRNNFLRYNDKCAVCNTKKKLAVHHKMPFHLSPELELDGNNLITVCREHHYTFGHLCNWSSYNDKIVEDSILWNHRITNRP